MNCDLNWHIVIIISIIILSGIFGGYLNYLHSFDVQEEDKTDTKNRRKYILLGVGAAFLVPAFLKMIASELVKSDDNNDYLIFAGFCLIAAIFSRRFVTSIGDKILEAAKNAEKSAEENKKQIKSTQVELISAKERIEDVRLSAEIGNNEQASLHQPDSRALDTLIELANNYVKSTSISDYFNRIKAKAELGRRMGELIIRNNLEKTQLLEINQSEGMYLAIAYSVQLKPSIGDIDILKNISKRTTQLYTMYSILVAYDTLIRNSSLQSEQFGEIALTANSFRKNADSALIRKIEDTLYLLGVFDSK